MKNQSINTTVIIQKEFLALSRTIFNCLQSYEFNFSYSSPTDEMRENMALVGSVFLQELSEKLPVGKTIILENQSGIEKTPAVDKLYYNCRCGFLSEFSHYKILISKTHENKIEFMYSQDIQMIYKEKLNSATALQITIPEKYFWDIKQSVDLLFQEELVD